MLITLPINAMDQRYRRSGFTAENAVEWTMGAVIGTGAVTTAKKLLTPERNQLMEDIIEACECLKAWWKKELIQQQKD